jgi:two-component system sensor histidine kinase UhpB
MDRELFANPGSQIYEWQLKTIEGSTREVIFHKATFPDATSKVGGLIGVITDVTVLKEAEKQLRALAARMAEAGEEERQNLALELHDQVCQNLAMLGLTLESLKIRAQQEPLEELLSRLGQAADLVEQTGEITRELMEGLRPTVLDHYGLLEGLRRWTEQFSQRTGISVEVQGQEAASRLAAPVELALFRIAQEALSNVAKHARAT